MRFPFLSFIILLPALVGGVLLFTKLSRALAARSALIVSGLMALLVLGSSIGFQPAGGFAFLERANWLAAIGFEYHLGVDGISMVFLILAAVVVTMSLMASGKFAGADTTYYGLMLIFEAGLFGTFTAQNFLHFFLFWEVSLIPAFFLIKNYGGPDRTFAAIQLSPCCSDFWRSTSLPVLSTSLKSRGCAALPGWGRCFNKNSPTGMRIPLVSLCSCSRLGAWR
jgi:NADH-quinone oxidoreductase subunit M